MPKDTKTLGNNKARACESLGFVHKKDCARVLTHLLHNLSLRYYLIKSKPKLKLVVTAQYPPII